MPEGVPKETEHLRSTWSWDVEISHAALSSNVCAKSEPLLQLTYDPQSCLVFLRRAASRRLSLGCGWQLRFSGERKQEENTVTGMIMQRVIFRHFPF